VPFIARIEIISNGIGLSLLEECRHNIDKIPGVTVNCAQTPEIWLLYPMNDEMQDIDISFESFHQDGGVETKVCLFFVDVTDIQDSLGMLKEKLLNEVAVTE
jgi:hypothetical protein